MSTRENIAVFDRYLGGYMDAEEKAAFEERLNHSQSLKQELEAYIAFSATIKEGVEYSQIRDELESIHTDLYGKKKKTIQLFRPKYLIPIGLAASIALLLYFNPFGLGEGASNADYAYEPLANYQDDYATEEITETSDAEGEGVPGEENMMDSTVSPNSNEMLNDTLPPLTNTPNGTAFLIAEDGFFLTSKHLVDGFEIVQLQHKASNLTFEARVLYSDSLLDFAILQSSIRTALNFDPVPYELAETSPELGAEVFTLGYSKKEIVYTEGVVSSETGYESDSVYFEISLPSNAGNSGAPLFGEDGRLIGIVTAQNLKKQAVTYVLKPEYIQKCLSEQAGYFGIDMSTNYSKKRMEKKRRIKLYRPFILEVHTVISK